MNFPDVSRKIALVYYPNGIANPQGKKDVDGEIVVETPRMLTVKIPTTDKEGQRIIIHISKKTQREVWTRLMVGPFHQISPTSNGTPPTKPCDSVKNPKQWGLVVGAVRNPSQQRRAS
jgi:hypothetical protein